MREEGRKRKKEEEAGKEMIYSFRNSKTPPEFVRALSVTMSLLPLLLAVRCGCSGCLLCSFPLFVCLFESLPADYCSGFSVFLSCLVSLLRSLFCAIC